MKSWTRTTTKTRTKTKTYLPHFSLCGRASAHRTLCGSRNALIRFNEAQRALGWRVLWVAPWWLVRQKHIVLVKDLKAPLPAFPENSGIRWSRLSERDIPAMRALDPKLSEVEIRRRLTEGQECHLYWVGKTLAHYRWETQRSIYLPYLGISVRLLEGDVFGTETYTSPALRRQGIASTACVMAFYRMRQQGLQRNVISIAWWNHPSLRAEQERAGRAVAGCIGFWNLGPWQHHFAGGAVRLDGSFAFHVNQTPRQAVNKDHRSATFRIAPGSRLWGFGKRSTSRKRGPM